MRPRQTYHPAMRIGMMTKSPATVQVPTGLSNAISTTMITSATSTNQLEYGAKGMRKLGRESWPRSDFFTNAMWQRLIMTEEVMMPKDSQNKRLTVLTDGT